MSFFNNVELEILLLFMRSFNMTLAASGTLEAGVKVQYLHTLFHGEVLHHFDSLSSDVEIADPLTV